MTDPATCSLCQLPGASLQAGGDVGLCHSSCFRAFDRRCEAEEIAEARRGHLVATHHLEEATP
jgi:hypothetical protein